MEGCSSTRLVAGRSDWDESVVACKLAAVIENGDVHQDLIGGVCRVIVVVGEGNDSGLATTPFTFT